MVALPGHRLRRMSRTVATLVVAGVLAVSGCSTASEARSTGPSAAPSRPPSPRASPAVPSPVRSAPVHSAPAPAPASASASAPTATASTVPGDLRQPDPRWRFFASDHRWYRSAWFAGRHRVMVGFGCTRAPWYAADPRCPGHEGFHHGIDVAMRCGTLLYAGLPGRVVEPTSPGSPGPAYGAHAFRLRHDGVDVLIGHARRVLVRPGQRVRRGEPVARASDAGAPDGCHLHFEVRPAGDGYLSAVDPARYLGLR